MKRPLARIATLDGVKNVGRARRNALRSHNAAAAIGRGSGLAAIAQLLPFRTVRCLLECGHSLSIAR